MPYVSSKPIGLSNGDEITDFINVADTSVTTWTYPNQQNRIRFANKGILPITLTVGTNIFVVQPQDYTEYNANFTSFTTQSAGQTQEFYVRTTVFANVSGGGSSGGGPGVSVKAFGAVGDGVTDDTTAVQGALDSGYGGIFLPKGVYIVKNLQVPSNVTLEGLGTESTLKLHPASVDWDMVFNLSHCNNIRLANFSIDGNRSSHGLMDNQMHGIGMDNETTDITIENINIKNTGGDGIWIAGGTQWDQGVPTDRPDWLSQNIFIRGCTINDVGRQSIALVTGKKISIIGNTMDDQLDLEAEQSGISDISVIGNICESIACNNPINVEGRITMTGNTIIGDAWLWDCEHFTFSNNTVKGILRVQNSSYGTLTGNWAAAVICSGTNDGLNQQLTFNGNFVDTTNFDPTITETSGAAIWIWNSKDVSFNNNVIVSPRFHGIIIDGGVSNAIISANQLTDTDGTTATNGIEKISYGGDTSIHITHNLIYGYDKGISTDGSQPSRVGTLSHNVIEARTKNVNASIFDDLTVEHNTFIGDIPAGFYWSANALVRHNRFSNTVETANLLQVENCPSPIIEANYFMVSNLEAQLSTFGSTDINVRAEWLVDTGGGTTPATPTVPSNWIYSPAGVPFKPSTTDAGVVTWTFAGKAYDVFDRADSATTAGSATVGGAWVVQNGTWGINTNQLYCVSDGNTEKLTLTGSAMSDFTLQADVLGTLVSSANFSVPQLMVRYVDGNNHIKVYLQAGEVWVEALIDDSNVILGRANQVTADGTTYRVSVSVAVSKIDVSVDGVSKISYTLTAPQQTLFGSVGAVGVRLMNSGTPAIVAKWDNFIVI